MEAYCGYDVTLSCHNFDNAHCLYVMTFEDFLPKKKKKSLYHH